MRRILSAAAAALLLGGVLVVAAGPALAAPGDRPCGNGGGTPPQYPPGQSSGPGLSDPQPERGQDVTARSGRGSFDPGSRAHPCVNSVQVDLGFVTVDRAGEARIRFTVPVDLSLGAHNVTFTGLKNGLPANVSVPFQITSAAVMDRDGSAADPGANAGAGLGDLPRTGAEIASYIAAGSVLVLAGSGMIVVARRRRQQGPIVA